MPHVLPKMQLPLRLRLICSVPQVFELLPQVSDLMPQLLPKGSEVEYLPRQLVVEYLPQAN